MEESPECPSFEDHNKSVIQNAQPGDLLEIDRGWYAHWAVYIGNQEVIELKTIDGMNIVTVDAMIRRLSVWDTVRDSKVVVNNSLDAKHKPRPVEEIVEGAISMVGEAKHNTFWQNCEHFATYCRYGICISEQVETAIRLGLRIAEELWLLYKQRKETDDQN